MRLPYPASLPGGNGEERETGAFGRKEPRARPGLRSVGTEPLEGTQPDGPAAGAHGGAGAGELGEHAAVDDPRGDERLDLGLAELGEPAAIGPEHSRDVGDDPQLGAEG